MNYQVHISPVTSQKATIIKLLLRFLGPNQKVENLIKNGGTVLQNLNKEAETTVANEL
ncbi:MAG TPA: hypothetical protein VK021_00415 [Flavobacteriaceae bacterium]|nr:hypothetical protein [Flavobacteriaceae bacterium]